MWVILQVLLTISQIWYVSRNDYECIAHISARIITNSLQMTTFVTLVTGHLTFSVSPCLRNRPSRPITKNSTHTEICFFLHPHPTSTVGAQTTKTTLNPFIHTLKLFLGMLEQINS